MESFKVILEKIRLYIQVTHISEIARRYFIKNGLDGSMTTLGVILGAWFIEVDRPSIIVSTGLGACLAMVVSGLFGAYITEKAERRRQIKALEESMLANLDGSVHQNASDFVPALAALVDGLSPALMAVISLSPFLLSTAGILDIQQSYIISFAVTFLMLFILGLYLGHVAEEKKILYGLGMLAAGAAISAMIFLLERISG